MILINFSTAFRPMQIIQAETVLQGTIQRVIEVRFRIDNNADLLPQLRQALKGLEAEIASLKDERLVINPPDHSTAAALLAAFFYDRLGYFPPMLRTRIRPYGVMALEEVVEVIDLRALDSRPPTSPARETDR